MPRRQRRFIPGIPAHVVQRGINRQPTFQRKEDFEKYLFFLEEALQRYQVKLHSFCLMTNHVHLLLTPEEQDGISRVFQHLGRCYVRSYNKHYKRTGTLWEGRFKASLVQDETYLMSCYRYIEMNPVKAKMVSLAEHYPWSSYRNNALGEKSSLLSPHPLFEGLATKSTTSNSIYKEFTRFSNHESNDEMIQQATEKNWPLGNEQFLTSIEERLGKKLGYFSIGRPRSISKNQAG